jgi:hypothetical protein
VPGRPTKATTGPRSGLTVSQLRLKVRPMLRRFLTWVQPILFAALRAAVVAFFGKLAQQAAA